MLRVAIVDDDPWVRAGRAAALERTGRLAIVLVCDHNEAVARPSWDDVDVVLLDAHDPNAAFDRFVGVRVVQRVRAQRTREQTRVAVLTGHVFNDLLRVRMAEAGADALYRHADIRTTDDLVAVIEATAPATAPPAGEAHHRAGISPRASVNDAVTWAERHLGPEVLDDEAPQKALPITRRQIITARLRIARLVGLSPGRGAAGDRRTPEWREVTHFLQRARGAERRS